MIEMNWFDITRTGRLIVRKFRGTPISKTKNSITIMYNKKPLTLKRQDVTIWENGKLTS